MRSSLVLGLLLAGCGGKGSAAPAAAASQAAPVVSADIQQLGQSGVSGHITFTPVDNGVRVQGDLKGLPPDTDHGFHVHEKGDCSAADGSSAGGHFNPGGHAHGAPDAQSHAGDLGNVHADAQGTAHVDVTKTGVTADELVGKGVIVHAQVDDLKTQPTGNAGGRIGCGVIAK